MPATDCVEPVQVRCTCKRIQQQIPCHETKGVKNYRLPCDDTCAELKKSRLATPPTPPPVQTTTEEAKPLIETETPITKRKNRKANTNIETAPIGSTTPTAKKSRARGFVWTLNKVIVLFGLFCFTIVSLIIYMFNHIA